MAIWMDMTNSLYAWQGGVVGIIRAELEIAKNLKKHHPELRLSKFDGQRFVEVDREQIKWLWTCDAIGDGYLQATGRKQTAGVQTAPTIQAESDEFPKLTGAYQYSGRAVKRFYAGCKLLAKCAPGIIRVPLKKCYHLARRMKQYVAAHRKAPEAVVQTPAFSHPYQDGDLVFSCGWMLSGKEQGFERVKEQLKHFRLVYLIYDTIPVARNTRQFNTQFVTDSFMDYLQWASFHCDAMLFGGQTAMEDTQRFQQEHDWPVLPGYPVRFGSDIVHSNGLIPEEEVSKYLESIGVTGDFIIAVGSLDKRKNYDTLYRAFTILSDRQDRHLPQLVIVGKGDACPELLAYMQQDPRTKGKIVLVSPSDEQLNWLYLKAKFAVIASAYEGWSLTLPEALGYGKFVLTSDVAPLREIGQDYVDYVDTFDPYAWADAIHHYCTDASDLVRRTKRIQTEWKPITWEDCGKQVKKHLLQIQQVQQGDEKSTLYFDVTLTAWIACSNGRITGILRTELMLIKHMYHMYPNIQLFALVPGKEYGYRPIPFRAVAPIIQGHALDEDFIRCRTALGQALFDVGVVDTPKAQAKSVRKMERRQLCKDACWYFISCLPKKLRGKALQRVRRYRGTEEVDGKNISNGATAKLPFKRGDVVFTAATGFSNQFYDFLMEEKQRIGFKYCGIIYDFTPMIVPQFHTDETKRNYQPFLDFTARMSDCILYGGRTAQHDGIAYQQEHHLPSPKSYPIFFGSDATVQAKRDEQAQRSDRDVLKEMGIHGGYVLSVGTIEARKNYETLYRAYLRLLEGYDDIPQMVFAGHPGWRMASFLETLGNDVRVRGKILLLSPTDEQLDVLYRNCEFTILASLYEGWSLTLPESFRYEKFCLCCDTPALKETAGALSDYVAAFDEKKWCERIAYYHAHPEELRRREQDIHEKWHAITWKECATQVMGYLNELLQETSD